MVHIVPAMGLQAPSASSILSLATPLWTLYSVQWLAESIHLCICQALLWMPTSACINFLSQVFPLVIVQIVTLTLKIGSKGILKTGSRVRLTDVDHLFPAPVVLRYTESRPQ